MASLKGKIALVTGASSGIGSCIASALGAEGATVILVARNLHALTARANEINCSGGSALAIQADVTNEHDVNQAFATLLKTFSRLDLLVNNAGVFDRRPLTELSLETWEQVLAVNLRGPFLCTRAAMKVMQPQLCGRIINIGSLSAKRVRSDSAAYSASKHGLLGLTQVTALEGRACGISCGILQPGNVAVEKKSHVTEPMMSPEVVARMVVAMASLPNDINILESVMLPIGQAFVGRG